MAWWLEMKCDTRKPIRGACRSDVQESVPMSLAGHKQGDLVHVKQLLEKEARSLGWTLNRNTGWSCPNCSRMTLWCVAPKCELLAVRRVEGLDFCYDHASRYRPRRTE